MEFERLKTEFFNNYIVRQAAKQAIEQPLHILLAGCPIWASKYLIGLWWPGLIVSALYCVWREYEQWPSSRWWDPYLDWAFLLIGLVLGVFL